MISMLVSVTGAVFGWMVASWLLTMYEACRFRANEKMYRDAVRLNYMLAVDAIATNNEAMAQTLADSAHNHLLAPAYQVAVQLALRMASTDTQLIRHQAVRAYQQSVAAALGIELHELN